MRLGVAVIELWVAHGQRPKLRQHVQPTGLVRGVVTPGAYQFAQTVGASELLRDPPILRRALLNPLIQEGKEEVGLATELRIDDALGESRLVGDRLQAGAGVAPLNEYLPRRLEDRLAVALHLF